MSPRAAWRLEQLGFTAYDYAGGKMDWLGYDLPGEGAAVLAGTAVDRDVPRMSMEAPLGDVRRALERYGLAVVVTSRQVVMGIVTPDGIDGATAQFSAGDVMRFGVTTVRPSEDLEALVHRMHHAGADGVVVTRSDGVLVGYLHLDAALEHVSLHAEGGEAHP